MGKEKEDSKKKEKATKSEDPKKGKAEGEKGGREQSKKENDGDDGKKEDRKKGKDDIRKEDDRRKGKEDDKKEVKDEGKMKVKDVEVVGMGKDKDTKKDDFEKSKGVKDNVEKVKGGKDDIEKVKGGKDDVEKVKGAKDDGEKGKDYDKNDGEKGKGFKKKKMKKGEDIEEMFSDALIKSFLPFRIMLMVLGRTPLTEVKNGPSDYVFQGHIFSVPGLYFVFTTIILFYILLVGTWNLFVIVMDIDVPTIPTPELQKKEILFERIVIERHLVVFIVAWTSLIHSCIVSVNILMKREYMANYFDFWARAADKMYMDVARGVYKYSIVTCSVFLAMVFFLLILSAFRIGPSSIGGPTIVFMLMFRHLIPHPWIDQQIIGSLGIYEITMFQIIGGFFLLFIFISSKMYILVFLFKCKLLRNAFANWNGRVYAAVLRGGDFIQSDRGRTTYSLLFKDHCILLDLMEGTDRLFSTIIESYFGLQVVSICFEGYFFIRTAKWSSKQDAAAEDGTFFIRPYDYLPGLIILMQSIAILIIVSKAAAEVGEEALAGLEVIRRKTMLGRRTDEELYFMLSMFSSYTSYKKLQLSGGGYFYLDKEFIIGIVSTIFSYFIITYQFQPTLDFTPSDDVQRCHIGKFLEVFEGLAENHWLAKGPITPAPCDPLIFSAP